VITWTALSAAVLAGAGAVGTLVWRRYRAAMAADTEADTESPAGTKPDSATHSPDTPDARPADEASSVTDADASVPRPAKSTW
jgi:hypothetical protein